MDKNAARNFLKIGQSPIIRTKSGKTIELARMKTDDISRIEKLTNEELIDLWESLNVMIDVHQSFSVADLQELSLVNMEIESRDIPEEQLEERIKKIESFIEE